MKRFVKRYWFYLVLAIVTIWFLQRAILLTVENMQLAKSGQVKKATITNKEWESSSHRNSDGFYYEFTLNGIRYQGHTFDKDLVPNDSLEIVYLPNDPSINRPLDFIKRNYRTSY